MKRMLACFVKLNLALPLSPNDVAPECSGYKSCRDLEMEIQILESLQVKINQSAIGVMASSLIISSSELF
jgi:hypothetical protein